MKTETVYADLKVYVEGKTESSKKWKKTPKQIELIK